MASPICSALPTGTRLTPSGASSDVGPDACVTSVPRAAAARATA
jgi:hypothetical protein